ncbi:hypothetical protein LIER_10306 [Lithospermum erythrorhizon]|uniref:NAB domain-containing protein n=1 Tax=Lithospermum erythrorhizon TaxID=34254 RepID=A0AAV3PK21_LITER
MIGDHFININFWFNVDQSRLIVSIMDNMKGAGTSSSSKVQFPLHIGIGTLSHMMSKVQPQIMRRPKSNKSQMWWPDNHVSFKNSKWIQENLEEMDHKVKQMLKLIEEEPDSSTKKKPGKHSPKSPELIHLVDEFSCMYRLLAERYDHVNAEGPGGNTPDESSYIEYSESESDESSVVNSSAVVHPNVDELKILAMEEEMKSTKEKLLDSENEVGRLNQELKKIQESEQASRSQLERVMDQALESKGKLDKSASEVSDRDQEIRRLKEEIINSERSLSDVKTYHHEEIFELEKERSYLEKKVNEVNVWCQSLEEDVRQVQTEKSVLEASLRAEIEQLQTTVSNKNMHLNEITRDYNRLMDEKDKLNARVEEFIMETRSKDDHLYAMHLESVKMTEKMEGARKMTETLRSRVEELEDTVAKQQEMILEGAEEKREAIRQLCFSLEHYRIRHHELRESILSHKRLTEMAI